MKTITTPAAINWLKEHKNEQFRIQDVHTDNKENQHIIVVRLKDGMDFKTGVSHLVEGKVIKILGFYDDLVHMCYQVSNAQGEKNVEIHTIPIDEFNFDINSDGIQYFWGLIPHFYRHENKYDDNNILMENEVELQY